MAARFKVRRKQLFLGVIDKQTYTCILVDHA